jgi:acetyl esterase/lipase
MHLFSGMRDWLAHLATTVGGTAVQLVSRIGNPASATVLALLAATIGWASDSSPAPAVQTGLVYATNGGIDLKFDMASPQGPGPFPAVICIHGGGDTKGDRADLKTVISDLAQHGFVAASIDYRLAPQFVFPSNIEDVKCAVRHVRAKAGDYRIDPNRIGALGFSAGGRLALMLGATQVKDGFDGSAHGAMAGDSAVQAVVNFYGPGEYAVDPSISREQMRIMAAGLGSPNPTPQLLSAASPMTYFHAGMPPIMTLHGVDDKLVPIDLSRRMHERLRGLGIAESLVEFPGQGHGFKGADVGKSLNLALMFLTQHLLKAGEKNAR